jgi:F-type H+-transporting ATPase subunit epsilon
MAEAILDVRVVTPEGALYEGEASFVAAPAADGEVGVLPRHTPLISEMGTGVLRVTPADESGEARRFAVRGGFLQVVRNRVTLLVTEAVGPDDVDAKALADEREEVLGRLRRPESDEQFVELLDDRRWVEARQSL